METIRIVLRSVVIGIILIGLSQLFAGDQRSVLPTPAGDSGTVRSHATDVKKPLPSEKLTDGRIPISEPITISESGHYVITKNITSNSPSAINIATGNVILDLNGMTLTRTAIRILPGPPGGVTIRNGRLIDGGISTDIFANARTLEVESIEITNGGVNVVIVDLPLYSVQIERCKLFNSGIQVMHDPGSIQVRIVDNTLNNGGIYVKEGRNSLISGNRISNGNILIDGAVGVEVKENSVDIGGTYCIAVTPYRASAGMGRNLIEHNMVQGCETGILVSVSHTRVIENIASSNSGDGILVTDSVGDFNSNDHFENNQLNGNGGCGIRLFSESGHTIRGNNVRGNGISGIIGECGGDLGTNQDAGGNSI